MINYDRLWQTIKNKGLNKYKLHKDFRISKSQLSRLSHNKSVTTNTIDRLCNMLGCRIEEIAEHIPDDNTF